MRGKVIHWLVGIVLLVGWSPPPLMAQDEEAPAEEAPAEEAPAEEAPAEEAPGEEAPAEEAPVAEAPPGPVTEPTGMSLFDYIKAGGIIGYLILGLSVVGMGLIFENFYAVRRTVLMPPEIVDEVERLFQEEAYEEALELCDAEQNLLTNMIGAGLSKITGGYDAITESMSSALEEGSTALHQKVNFLSLIGNISPMMGLIGTVQGMIAAFQKISESGGTPKPSELADSISLALVTTMLGLLVAIPMLVFHMFLKNRVVKIVLEAAAIGTELMERFKTQKVG